MSILIGIDPGCSGSLVALDTSYRYQSHLLMPTMKVGSNSRVNAAAVAVWLNQWDAGEAHVYLESVHSMPKQGVSSVFTFGHSAGVVEGVVAGLGYPLTLVTPQSWKKKAGLIGSEKDAARARAIQLYPTIDVLHTKAKGQAVADAILIARFGS